MALADTMNGSDVAALLGMPIDTILQLAADSEFPLPIDSREGGRWERSAVLRWLAVNSRRNSRELAAVGACERATPMREGTRPLASVERR